MEVNSLKALMEIVERTESVSVRIRALGVAGGLLRLHAERDPLGARSRPAGTDQYDRNAQNVGRPRLDDRVA